MNNQKQCVFFLFFNFVGQTGKVSREPASSSDGHSEWDNYQTVTAQRREQLANSEVCILLCFFLRLFLVRQDHHVKMKTCKLLPRTISSESCQKKTILGVLENIAKSKDFYYCLIILLSINEDQHKNKAVEWLAWIVVHVLITCTSI